MDRRTFVQTAAGAAALAAGSRWLKAEPQGQVSVTAGAADRPKKSIILQMIQPGDLPIEAKFALAKKCGFEGIEADPLFDRADEIRAASEKTGLPAHSVIFGGWKPCLSSPDAAEREAAVERLKQGLKFAKAIGADNLLLVPAVVNEKTRYVEAYDRSQEGIGKVLPLAEEMKVVIAVEEVWNNFLLSPLEFARYVDEFKSPYLQAYFDVGNIVKNGWPEDWIRTLGKRIRRIHLKDFKRSTREWAPLLEGEVDWKEVRKALGEVGFTSYLTAELEGGDETRLKDISQRIDKIIAGS